MNITTLPSRFRPRAGAMLACAVLALPLAACNKQDAGNAPAAGEPPAMPVSVTTVQRQALPLVLDAVGQTEGSREIDIQARVAGQLERTLYREGEAVKAGAPLFAIERSSYENARQQAQAELAQRQAQAEQAQREARRLKPLADDKAIPQREYDDALSSERSALAALDAARAALRTAELNLGYTTVSAPFAGIAGRALKSQGALLTPGADAQLTTLVQTDPLWVRFSLSAEEAARVRRSGKTAVQLTNAAGETLLARGQLNFAAASVDPRMGTVQLRAEFANPNLTVQPGQFVRVQVQAGETTAFRVPQAAVVQSEDGRMVWVARAGKAVPTPVEAGTWVGSDWAIYKGLAEGDQVITDNLIKLRPDAPVAPQAAASAPAAAR